MKLLTILVSLFCCGSVAAADESLIGDVEQSGAVLLADFEAETYDGWTVKGDAFGDGPVTGTLAGQQAVSGFRGRRLVNSFRNGDGTTGSLTSREFTVERRHIAFLIGGGRLSGQTGIELRVDGKPVRTATGHDSEELEWSSWEVTEFNGRTATLRIYDDATGGWGHINVDHIIQTDAAPPRFDLEYRLSEYRDTPGYLNEPFRPQFHFTPEINWMNDPNGLVYHDGEYHLFYQFNPAGITWGHMSWGHAVSRDLVHWEHLPLAIPEEDGIMAFSGCCVVDHHNSSGFGSTTNPPMVAIYTGHGHGRQVQNVAYSTDNGRTWTKFADNPVLDLNMQDFRDPSVYWHDPTSRWVMVVSLANDKVLVFYASKDLKQWEELSRFGPAGVPDKPNWECPDLFELPVENENGKRLWVLEVDMGSGAIAGGSGGEYFVGHFDGTQFEAMQDSKWVDFGRDFYAPISWKNVPENDGRRLWLGWFNNWETCLLPTSPWRSAMSIPRSLTLRKTGSGYILVQRPVKELQSLRGEPVEIAETSVTDSVRAVGSSWSVGNTYELRLTLTPNAESSGVRVCAGEDEFTEIGYDRSINAVYVDRTRSGMVDFDPRFAGRHAAPVSLDNGTVSLTIFVDRSSVEVFINDGQAVISDRIFPSEASTGIELFTRDGSAQFSDVRAWRLKSVWHGG